MPRLQQHHVTPILAKTYAKSSQMTYAIHTAPPSLICINLQSDLMWCELKSSVKVFAKREAGNTLSRCTNLHALLEEAH